MFLTYGSLREWFVASVVVLIVGLALLLTSRFLADAAMRGEFARGYTTLRRFSGRYEYRDSHGVVTKVGPPKPIDRPAGGAVAETLPPPSLGRMRSRRRGYAVVVFLAGVLFVVVIVILRTPRPDSLWVVAAIGVGFVIILSLVGGVDATRALLYRSRVRAVDDGAVSFVVPSPATVKQLIADDAISSVPLLLALIVDRRGIRLWTVTRRPTRLLDIPSTSTPGIDVVNTASGFARDHMLVRISSHDQASIHLGVLRTFLPSFPLPEDMVPGRAANMKKSLVARG